MSNSTISRRQFVQRTGALASISLVAPSALRAQNRYDVVVIGAGLSGLNTALLLEQLGLNVQVVEGRDRVGGRVLSVRDVPGNPEAGGTVIGGGYARCIDAAQKYGVELVDLTPQLPFFGQRELMLDGMRVARSDWPSHAQNSFPDSVRDKMPWEFFSAMSAGKNPLNLASEWRDPKHAALDISVHEFLRNTGASDAAIELGFSMNTNYGTSAYDVSLLMMFYLQAFGRADAKAAVGGIPAYTAVGGNQSLPEAMAAALQNELHLSRSVVGIRSGPDQAEVHCDDGTVYKANYVVCSVPFSVLRHLKIDPPLEGLQAEAVQTLESQPLSQVHMVATEPFWDEDEMSPSMWTDTVAGMVVAERKDRNDPKVITSLTAWANGRNALQLDRLPPGEAGKLTVKQIEKLRPAAKGKIEAISYKSWARDPYSAGDWCYWQPGQITRFANNMSDTHGRIHFCGEHTSVSTRGMEGAMESGERVALEVFSRI